LLLVGISLYFSDSWSSNYEMGIRLSRGMLDTQLLT